MAGDTTSPRYERKFLVTGMDEGSVRSIVRRHKAMFVEAYPPRRVNNIYFDTPLRRNYTDNVIGSAERIKPRVRWYGELFGPVDDPKLEFKIKSGLVGWKETHPLPCFELDESFDARRFRKWLGDIGLSPKARARLGGNQPTLVNSYRRSYFVTRADEFRVTIDVGLTYYKVNRLSNRFLVSHIDPFHVVVELKYLRELEGRANRVASLFPFRMSRSSKYVTGLEAVGST